MTALPGSNRAPDARIALVTGASRGVGARVAMLLGEQGVTVLVNYRDKQRRAEEVAAAIREAGGSAVPVRADVTIAADLQAMFTHIREQFGRLDLLVLNASGGLEKQMPADYAMRLNRDAQLALVDGALPLMPPGSRIVFVTSHMAHFHGQVTSYSVYEPVATSKRAGEDALRERILFLDAHGISLIVVSGDLIEGTTTPQLMQRIEPGLIEARRQQAGGWLPTIDDFSQAIVAAATDAALPSGHTVYVGSIE
ncbi:MAG TPA: SDR family oxidoreductase [Tepidiformaceae bacterium]|nr:SDR family oxidoreductase [Tepidiformaceae bacterium]